MKVLYIFNGMVKNGDVVGISGGDIRLLEIIRNSGNAEPYLLTTANGLEFIKRNNQSYKKAYLFPGILRAGILSNLGMTIQSWFVGRTGGASEFHDGIVYSSCEHLYDVLPALRLSLFNKCEWYAVYHWVEDYPWREKRGNTPWLRRYSYWANRAVAGWLIKHFSDRILAVSDQTRQKLIDIKHVKAEKIKAVYCGVDYPRIRAITENNRANKGRTYDAVFMKRLNYGKGVLDLLEIWRLVVQSKPDARLAIIGDGGDDVLEKIHSYISEHKLERNIELLGVIYDFEEKFKVITSSRVFLLPTHEENWAIVIGEAMAAGVPVVVSKLKEIEPIWQDNVVWCEVGDTGSFSGAVLSLLNDDTYATQLAAKAQAFIPRYDWVTIAAAEFTD